MPEITLFPGHHEEPSSRWLMPWNSSPHFQFCIKRIIPYTVTQQLLSLSGCEIHPFILIVDVLCIVWHTVTYLSILLLMNTCLLYSCLVIKMVLLWTLLYIVFLNVCILLLLCFHLRVELLDQKICLCSV